MSGSILDELEPLPVSGGASAKSLCDFAAERSADWDARPDNVDPEDISILALMDRVVEGGAVGKAVGRGADEKGHWALEGLTTTPGECANNTSGGPCSSKRVVDVIAEFAAKVQAPAAPAAPSATLPTAPTAAAAAVRKAAAALNCTSESCVVANPAFVRYAETKGITAGAIEKEKETKFKPTGPRNTTELLNNFQIDDTLHRWAKTFPELFTYDFAMMDFDKTGDRFNTLDVADILEGRVAQVIDGAAVRRPARCLACVLNTDSSTGPGKHWVAAFVDTRGRGATPWTVEYFNSAGRPPPKAMVGWMERTRARLERFRATSPAYGTGPVESVAVTSISHQNGQTECGLYALFYIRKRAEGTPYSFFGGDRIPDGVMTLFRQHVFR